MKALALALTLIAGVAAAAEPAVHEGDFVLKDFRFASGESLPELRLHYRTLGKLDREARNVLTLDGTITGVIDWGDMTSGDPAIDLAAVWMLLSDEAARAQAQRAYGAAGSALWTRARGWAVLFGVMLLDTGLAGNARNAVMGELILRRI